MQCPVKQRIPAPGISVCLDASSIVGLRRPVRVEDVPRRNGVNYDLILPKKNGGSDALDPVDR